MKNICLVGFMGVGKTTVGRELAKDLKKKFIDTDREIEKDTSLRISDIFDFLGEEYFRLIETEKIKEVSKLKHCIISTGGGSYCSDQNIQILNSSCITIYLKLPFDDIINRMSKLGFLKRPLMQDLDKARNLFITREEFYSQAHFCLNVENKTVEEVKKDIRLILKSV